MRSLRTRSAEGSSAVEFVLIVPLLVVLVFGIIQFGIAYNRSQGMHAAAREGARLASVGATLGDITTRVGSALDGTTVTASDVTASGLQVRRYAEGADPTNTSLGTPVTASSQEPCDGSTAAHAVRVDVEVTQNVSKYAITIPFLPSWGQTFRSTAVFRCEGGS